MDFNLILIFKKKALEFNKQSRYWNLIMIGLLENTISCG